MAGCADDATDTGNSYRRVSRSVSVIAIPAQLETLTESVTAVGTEGPAQRHPVSRNRGLCHGHFFSTRRAGQCWR